MRLLLPLLIIVFLVPVLCRADVLVLKDGTRLEGKVKKTDGGWQVTAPDGKVRQVAASEVQSIELGSRGSEGQNSSAALASLRRSVEALTDLNQIVERYERFIANSKDETATAEAQKDLAIWQDRRDRGLIKQGTNWVTPEQAEALRVKALVVAAEAREQLRAGRVAEAESLIQQALDQDPTNPAAMYLRGVMLYRKDKLVDARKAFEAVSTAVEKHAPTANNLAVILYRQNQQGGALTLYDQAMQFAPVNKFILDNVADAIGTLPEEQRKGKAVERVGRRFAEQDTILQQQLAPQGLYRWGSSWVDQKQLDALKVAEKEILDKLQQLEQEFEQNKQRIAAIEQQITVNEREMQEIESRCVVRDSDGKLRYFPKPQAYYDLQRENVNLRTEQQSLQGRFDTLRETARRTQQQLPTPKFTGVQHIVGVEGTPLLEPARSPAPATGPT